MSEKDMREILAAEWAKDGWPDIMGRPGMPTHSISVTLRAMQEVERRTIERCAKVAKIAAAGDGDNEMFDAGWDAACAHIEEAIRALQDAPSDDTPPAKEGV
jgi:hypothetical protein